MRIATWNLQRGGSARVLDGQRKVLEELDADVVVLTEPSNAYSHGPVVSPPIRSGDQCWVAIVGAEVRRADIEIPAERMAAAAMAPHQGRELAVYGSVLPWSSFRLQAPELARDGEDATAAFLRLLEEQAGDIRELMRRTGSPVVWAGDFNQSLQGPNSGGADRRRVALASMLDELGLRAWNAAAQHYHLSACAIDLICGPRDMEPVAQGRIAPALGGVELSDHAGYWVDVRR